MLIFTPHRAVKFSLKIMSSDKKKQMHYHTPCRCTHKLPGAHSHESRPPAAENFQLKAPLAATTFIAKNIAQPLAVQDCCQSISHQ